MMQIAEKACLMIVKIDWDGLSHEDSSYIDCFANNWHKL